MMLSRNSYFIRTHIGLLKLSDAYDILDPITSEQLGIAKERPGTFLHFLRLFIDKQILPTRVDIYEGSDITTGTLLFSIKIGFTFLRHTRIKFFSKNGELLGWLLFKSKVLFACEFAIFDTYGKEIAFVKGDWKGWNFKFFNSENKEIGTVSKKWAGIGKELFTTADNYIITIKSEINKTLSLMILATGLSIDIIYRDYL